MGEACLIGVGRTQGPRGGLSRNKVAVGESAAGSPPKVFQPPLTGVHILKLTQGLVAQLEERRLCEAEASGSNPDESIVYAPGDEKVVGEGSMPVGM